MAIWNSSIPPPTIARTYLIGYYFTLWAGYQPAPPRPRVVPSVAPSVPFSITLLPCERPVAFALAVKLLWDVAMLPFYLTPWIAHFSWVVFRRSLLSGL